MQTKPCSNCGSLHYKYAKLCVKCSKIGCLNPNFGKVSALRGKKISDFRTKDSVAKSMERLSKGLFSGHSHSEESKKKTGNSVRGVKNGFYNRKHTKETIDIIREKTIQQFQNNKSKNCTSSLEDEFCVILNNAGIKYKRQVRVGMWLFDFYLPELNIYIECDGDYWHRNPLNFGNKKLTDAQQKNLINDKRKNTFMKNKGIDLLRFWENDIINDKQSVINKLKLLCSKSA